MDSAPSLFLLYTHHTLPRCNPGCYFGSFFVRSSESDWQERSTKMGLGQIVFGMILGAILAVAVIYHLGIGYRPSFQQKKDDDYQQEQDPEDTPLLGSRSSDSAGNGARGRPMLRSNRSAAASHHITRQTSFLTLLLEQLWGHIQVAASTMIRETVQASLGTLPGLSLIHI